MANKAKKITLISSLAVMVAMFTGCGADVGMDLDNLTNNDSKAVEENLDDFCEEELGIPCDGTKPPRIPVCRAEGTRGEGWYWADNNELIKYENCSRDSQAECNNIGSRSEGWYSENGLITWDRCHRTVRVALYGEPCGGSIGYSCYEGQGIYCQGMPTAEGLVGGVGTCREIGYCESDGDCMADDNTWERESCEGYARCAQNSCNWVCAELEPTVWSWTTVLTDEAESEHPYTSNTDQTWTITRDGAAKIKLNLTINVENGYDWVVVWSDSEQPAVWLSGELENEWTPEFDSNTVYISFVSDYSIENWGVKVEAVSYYEQIPQGSCNASEDCSEGTSCNPSQCINPFAPCYGECQ